MHVSLLYDYITRLFYINTNIINKQATITWIRQQWDGDECGVTMTKMVSYLCEYVNLS